MSKAAAVVVKAISEEGLSIKDDVILFKGNELFLQSEVASAYPDEKYKNNINIRPGVALLNQLMILDEYVSEHVPIEKSVYSSLIKGKFVTMKNHTGKTMDVNKTITAVILHPVIYRYDQKVGVTLEVLAVKTVEKRKPTEQAFTVSFD